MFSIKKFERFEVAGVHAILILAESQPRMRHADNCTTLLMKAIEENTGEHLDGAWQEMWYWPLSGMCPPNPGDPDGWQLSRHVVVQIESLRAYVISTNDRVLMHFSGDVIADFLWFVCKLGYIPTSDEIMDRFVRPYQQISDDLKPLSKSETNRS